MNVTANRPSPRMPLLTLAACCIALTGVGLTGGAATGCGGEAELGGVSATGSATAGSGADVGGSAAAGAGGSIAAPAGSCDDVFSGEIETKTGTGYVLELAPARTSAVGEAAASCVRLTPTAGYKVNVAFPFKMTVTVPEGVDGNEAITKADAVKFDEKEGRVPIAFIPKTGGEKSFAAEVRFSVCTEKVCETPVEELAWTVTAR